MVALPEVRPIAHRTTPRFPAPPDAAPVPPPDLSASLTPREQQAPAGIGMFRRKARAEAEQRARQAAEADMRNWWTQADAERDRYRWELNRQAVAPGPAAARAVVLRTDRVDAYGRTQLGCMLAGRFERRSFDRKVRGGGTNHRRTTRRGTKTPSHLVAESGYVLFTRAGAKAEAASRVTSRMACTTWSRSPPPRPHAPPKP
ncbi:hypothetical protein [Streptosporangium pseudovulgare]|uniref:Uncharacterized protein n=1 Tax=Streptosporangium pseudovulgare TaxID=35765 RepID=A0ABQ2RGP3_9ACTN|nr:hypothetical protein [Streptosporangium pseudovulgare]GGQ25748.1 hypothetical protein GCM10010140_64990 [Streptosporangium pseudovulgare]